MRELTADESVLDQVDVEANVKVVVKQSCKLSGGLKFVSSVLVLQLDLLDLVEPSNVELDVGVCDSAAAFLVNAHLNLGHRQI